MKFRVNGKLLLSAEYSILRGAKALSVPTRFGQGLEILPNSSGFLHWKSLDENGKTWFEADFNAAFDICKTTNQNVAAYLAKLLKAAHKLNPSFYPKATNATSTLEFNAHWGLGSSSTLVALVALWANVNALDLFFKTSVGSGYDVATALAKSPIVYTLKNGNAAFEPAHFNPPFKENLHFLYLGKKQRSAAEVENFNEKIVPAKTIEEISAITDQLVVCEDLELFKDLLDEHEKITSAMLGYPTIKEQFFADFTSSIKSLGAWGGDFVMVVCEENELDYFRKKGYKTILGWAQMIGI